METNARQTLNVSLLTLLARGLGFLRVIAMSIWVGSRNVAHAFSAANQIPNVIFEVVCGGALSGAIVPVLAGPLKSNDHRAASKIASAIITWAVILGFFLAVCLYAGADIIAAAFPTAGERAGQSEAMAYLLKIFAWQIPFYAFGVAATGVLHSLGRFIAPALAPSLSSITVIFAFALFGYVSAGADSIQDTRSLLVLALGVNAGVVALTLPLLVPLMRSGLKIRPHLHLENTALTQLLRLAFAGILGVGAQQVATVAIIWGARAFGEVGAQAVFMYSQAVTALPVAVMILPVATVMFPALAQADGAQRQERAGELLGKVMVPALIGTALVVALAPAADQFFSALTPVPGLAPALIAQAPLVAGLGLSLVLARIAFAYGDGATARTITVTGWLAVALTSILIPWLMVDAPDTAATIFALSLAQSIGMCLGAIIGALLITRRYRVAIFAHIHGRELLIAALSFVYAGFAAWGSATYLTGGAFAAVIAGAIIAAPLLALWLSWWRLSKRNER